MYCCNTVDCNQYNIIRDYESSLRIDNNKIIFRVLHDIEKSDIDELDKLRVLVMREIDKLSDAVYSRFTRQTVLKYFNLSHKIKHEFGFTLITSDLSKMVRIIENSPGLAYKYNIIDNEFIFNYGHVFDKNLLKDAIILYHQLYEKLCAYTVRYEILNDLKRFDYISEYSTCISTTMMEDGGPYRLSHVVERLFHKYNKPKINSV